MARLERFTRRHLRDARECGVLPKTRVLRDVHRVVRVLARAPSLPLEGDVYAILPDDGSGVCVLAHGRRVPQRNLWVWYWATNEDLNLVALTRVPPVAR